MHSKFSDHVPRALRTPPGGQCIHDDGSEYTSEQWEFIRAMHSYKQQFNRPYPDCKDVLRVVYSLGYRKIMPPIPVTEVAR